MTLEHRFDIAFVASHALREKQIQQIYRPYVAVHKWFARRPGSLFRSLILAEFADAPLGQSYYRPHDFADKVVVDPFMGGGTPLIEANRLGCEVMGFDINPMATWICREAIEHLDLERYTEVGDDLVSRLKGDIGNLYLTDCPHYGDIDVPAKSFLWIKIIACVSCRKDIDLFPGYLVAEDVRHPQNVLVCHACGDLNEVRSVDKPGFCGACHVALRIEGPAKRGQCACPHCGATNKFPRAADGQPRHRLFAIEYYNPHQKAVHRGRFFKKPDSKDLARVEEAVNRWSATSATFVPDDEIPRGDETDRLHRWGYHRYRDMFNARQLLGMETSARIVSTVEDFRIRRALATNLSDLLRYQNMLCRYDTMALKALDIFSVHGFPVGLVQCESNLLGIANGKGASIGSGGWTNILEKYRAAKMYCDAPFEMRVGERGKRAQVQVKGEWIGEHRDGSRARNVTIRCASSTEIPLAIGSLDACFTDPPYFGMVQYGELMDFCYVWIKKLASPDTDGFGAPSSRSASEITGNTTTGRDLARFTEGLAQTYRRIATALKPGAPLAFTFHHNRQEAYGSIAVSILDAGLTCSASIPCPAEMTGSIHISGTKSSIIDTVFVCRSSGSALRHLMFEDANGLAAVVESDLVQLRLGGVKPTLGDTRCIVLGHLARMAIWNLRGSWDPDVITENKLRLVLSEMNRLASLDAVVAALQPEEVPVSALPLFMGHEQTEPADAISF